MSRRSMLPGPSRRRSYYSASEYHNHSNHNHVDDEDQAEEFDDEDGEEIGPDFEDENGYGDDDGPEDGDDYEDELDDDIHQRPSGDYRRFPNVAIAGSSRFNHRSESHAYNIARDDIRRHRAYSESNVERADPGEENRRDHHNQLERKRRASIKKSYNDLRDVIPSLRNSKPSRAVILQAAVDHLQEINEQYLHRCDSISRLRQEMAQVESDTRRYEAACERMDAEIGRRLHSNSSSSSSSNSLPRPIGRPPTTPPGNSRNYSQQQVIKGVTRSTVRPLANRPTSSSSTSLPLVRIVPHSNNNRPRISQSPAKIGQSSRIVNQASAITTTTPVVKTTTQPSSNFSNLLQLADLADNALCCVNANTPGPSSSLKPPVVTSSFNSISSTTKSVLVTTTTPARTTIPLMPVVHHRIHPLVAATSSSSSSVRRIASPSPSPSTCRLKWESGSVNSSQLKGTRLPMIAPSTTCIIRPAIRPTPLLLARQPLASTSPPPQLALQSAVVDCQSAVDSQSGDHNADDDERLPPTLVAELPPPPDTDMESGSNKKPRLD